MDLPHSKTCCAKDCSRSALWVPFIKVWARGWPTSSMPIEVEVGMQFCEEHKHILQPSDIRDLTPRVREVCKKLNRAEPDTDRMIVELRPLLLA